jgi:hypothetical protein
MLKTKQEGERMKDWIMYGCLIIGFIVSIAYKNIIVWAVLFIISLIMIAVSAKRIKISR